jgi:hypothetical protein
MLDKARPQPGRAARTPSFSVIPLPNHSVNHKTIGPIWLSMIHWGSYPLACGNSGLAGILPDGSAINASAETKLAAYSRRRLAIEPHRPILRSFMVLSKGGVKRPGFPLTGVTVRVMFAEHNQS